MNYTIRQFDGGISEFNNKGIAGSFKHGEGLAIRERENTLTCGQKLVKESAAIVTDLIRFIIPCSDGQAYGFGDTGKIYKRKGTTWTLEYTDANGEIKGAYEWNGYLYWACNTKISRIAVADADDGTWDADVAHDWNTGLTAADWHTMLIACGSLMICNDKFLALIDYASAGFSAEALNLYPNNLAKCLDEDGFNVIIGTTDKGKAEKGFIQTWQTSAFNWIKKKKLASKGVNALITAEYMLAQCGDEGEVYFSDMTSRVPLFTFPDGGYVIPDGVCNRKGLAMFGVYGSNKCGVYSYGRSKKNFPYALNLDYVGSHGKITGISYGSISMVDGTLLVAWKDGASYGVDALSTTTKADGIYEGLEWDGGMPNIKKTFKQVKVVMEALPEDCTIEIKYKINGVAWVIAKTLSGGNTFTTKDATRALFNINAEGEIIEIRAKLVSNGNTSPKIHSINTYFDIPKMSEF